MGFHDRRVLHSIAYADIKGFSHILHCRSEGGQAQHVARGNGIPHGKTHLLIQARTVFFWTDEHIKGHFAMYHASLCIIRYLQYHMQENGMEVLSAEEIMKGISQPRALVLGKFPKSIVTPTEVPQTYLDIASLLKLPPLLTNMSLMRFRSATKLNLMDNKF